MCFLPGAWLWRGWGAILSSQILGHQQRPSEVDDELSVRDGQEAEQGKAAKTDGEHILGSLSCTTQLALFGCGVPLKWLGLGSRGKT